MFIFSFTATDTANQMPVWRMDCTLAPKLWSRGCDIMPSRGKPPASYQWYLERSNDISTNGSIAIHADSYLNITLLNNNRTLYFSEFKEEHNGTYICHAENFLGKTNYSHFPSVTVESE